MKHVLCPDPVVDLFVLDRCLTAAAVLDGVGVQVMLPVSCCLSGRAGMVIPAAYRSSGVVTVVWVFLVSSMKFEEVCRKTGIC